MAVTSIEQYPPMATGRIAVAGDGSIWLYQPNIPAGMIQLEPPGSVAEPPALTAAPAITGTPTSGQTLTVSNGTWLNAPTSYTYVWFSGGLVIAGQTANTYVLTNQDKGNMIAAQVTATNASGTGIAQAPSVGPVS